MRKIYFIVIVILAVFVSLNIRCTKINTDQPCGLYMNNTQQLYKSSDDRCYYIDNPTGNKIFVDKSNCNCF
jgi:hypothetical protein